MKNLIHKILLERKSNLNDNFWKWFGKSRTVKSGEPVEYYHGSNVNRRFSKFNEGKPIWFSKYEGYANAFTNGKGKIFTVYLKVEKPIYVGFIDGIANTKRIEYLSELTNIKVDILKEILKESNGVNLFNITGSEKFMELLVRMGYDSIEAKEGGGITSFAVFKSNQIKSINNNGNWDINNSNINK